MSVEHAAPVVFVAGGAISAQVELASALQRRGTPVAFVTRPATNPAARARREFDRLVFPQIENWLPDNGAPDELTMSKIASLGPASVEITEDLALGLVDHALGIRGLTRGRALLADKWQMSQLAIELGIPTPATWQEAPADWPGPIVVKPRFGGGGVGVSICPDAETAAATSATAPEPVVFQEMLSGEVVTVSGVAAAGELLSWAAYRIRPLRADPLGPAASLRTIDDPGLVEGVSRLLGHAGYSGMFAVQHVRDGSGRPKLIDANMRVFGPWAALQRAGLDLVSAYLHVIGAGPRPAASSLPAGLQSEVVRVDAFRYQGAWQREWPLLRQLVRQGRPEFGDGWAAWTLGRATLNAAASVAGRGTKGR